MVNLKALNLAQNFLTSLPASLSNLPLLDFLNLSGNDLQKLPVNFGNLKSLTNLDLSENKFYDLPKSISLLQKLNRIVLSTNKFKDFPASLAKNISLKEVNLRNNALTSLPRSFLFLKRLEYLDVSYNKLTKLPLFIATLPNLIIIRIQGNSFEFFKDYYRQDQQFKLDTLFLKIPLRTLHGIPQKFYDQIGCSIVGHREYPYHKFNLCNNGNDLRKKYLLDLPNSQNELYEYYEEPILDLLERAHSGEMLSDKMWERIGWECSYEQKSQIEQQLSPNHPAVVFISQRFKISNIIL